MTKQKLNYVILSIWAVVYIWSFIALKTTDPTGFGFTGGLNRITTFLGWQFFAGLISIFGLALSFEFAPRSRARWLVRVPFILAMLLLVAILGIIGYAWLGDPAAVRNSTPATPPAVTKPAEPVQ